jgi:hypothetical protein
MSALHSKGLLDPSSVLDDELPAVLNKNSHYHKLSCKSKVVADVMHSNPTAVVEPQRQAYSFIDRYSSLPSLQCKLNAANDITPTVAIPHGNPIVPLNMDLQNTIASQRMMVRECVKTKLFRRLKFFKKDVHGLFDRRQGTVCAMIIANCNVEAENADEYWWADMRKLVVCTHTDRRNNVIKNMRLRFRGKFAMQL